MAGLFISFDGIDGTGKSTQCALLIDWLRSLGCEVVHCIDPGGTSLGEQLREILLHNRAEISNRAEALLFMSARAELVERKIKPALAQGKIVICDRFLLSTVVYQGHAGNLSPEELWRIGSLAADGIEPILTFVFDLPVIEAAKRRGRPADRMESRSLEYHEKVRQGFLWEAQRRPQRFAVIDASASVDAIAQSVRQRLVEILPGIAEKAK